MKTDKDIIHERLISVDVPTEASLSKKELSDEYSFYPYVQPLVNMADYPDIRTEPSSEGIDLGLSVLWAACNIGAEKPSDYGDYYAWGETYTKNNYSKETYTYTDNPETLLPSNDVATQKIGSDWRMPTLDEIEELIQTRDDSNYQWTWKAIDGHNGWEIKYLINNNSIFLPAAGYLYETSLYDADYGYYWSSSRYTDYPSYAWLMYFNSEVVDRNGDGRNGGQSVRPVKQK